MRFGQLLFILPPPASLSRNLFRICASREEGRLVAEPLLCALSRWGDDADAAYRRGMRQDSTDGRRAGPGTVRGRKPADGADILIEVFLLRGGASGPGSDRICGLSAGGGDWPSQGFGGRRCLPGTPAAGLCSVGSGKSRAARFFGARPVESGCAPSGAGCSGSTGENPEAAACRSDVVGISRFVRPHGCSAIRRRAAAQAPPRVIACVRRGGTLSVSGRCGGSERTGRSVRRISRMRPAKPCTILAGTASKHRAAGCRPMRFERRTDTPAPRCRRGGARLSTRLGARC